MPGEGLGGRELKHLFAPGAGIYRVGWEKVQQRSARETAPIPREPVHSEPAKPFVLRRIEQLANRMPFVPDRLYSTSFVIFVAGLLLRFVDASLLPPALAEHEILVSNVGLWMAVGCVVVIVSYNSFRVLVLSVRRSARASHQKLLLDSADQFGKSHTQWLKQRDALRSNSLLAATLPPSWKPITLREKPALISVFGGSKVWHELLATLGAPLIGNNKRLVIVDCNGAGCDGLLSDVVNRYGGHLSVTFMELSERQGLAGLLSSFSAPQLADELALACDFDSDLRNTGRIRALDSSVLAVMMKRLDNTKMSGLRISAALELLSDPSAESPREHLSIMEAAGLGAEGLRIGESERTSARVLARAFSSFNDSSPVGEPWTSWWAADSNACVIRNAGHDSSARRIISNLTLGAIAHSLKAPTHDTGKVVVIVGAHELPASYLKSFIRQAESANVTLVMLFDEFSQGYEWALDPGRGAALLMRSSPYGTKLMMDSLRPHLRNFSPDNLIDLGRTEFVMVESVGGDGRICMGDCRTSLVARSMQLDVDEE